MILSRPNDTAKMNYLKSLFNEVYVKDIVERKKIERQDVLEQILDLLYSSIGYELLLRKCNDSTEEDYNKALRKIERRRVYSF